MLPQIVTPEYDIKLYSIAKPVTFRPYLVKEEKLLLMAQQGNDEKEVDRAVRQIIRNCTDGVVNVDNLPTFDVEYMFLQLRSKSVNNIIETQYECQNEVPGKPVANIVSDPVRCGQLVNVTINIDDIKLVVPEGHTNKFMLTENVGVVLKYPRNAVVADSNADLVSIVAECLQQVYQTDGTVTEIAEEDPEAVKEFVGNLSLAQLDKIRPFFETMPAVTYSFKFVCPKCQYEEDITLRGLMDFFG